MALPFLEFPYVYPPLVLVGPVLRFLSKRLQSCTFIAMDVYPHKYWWPLLQRHVIKARKLTDEGDTNALLIPSMAGWIPHPGIPGDLWAFPLQF